MLHEFGESLKRGEAAERFLDALFARANNIRLVSRQGQRQGMDRIWTPKARPSVSVRVEYKADWQAHKTGRVFVETTSVDEAGKAGWALTSQAELLVYYLPRDDLVYLIWFRVLRQQMERWAAEYGPPRPAQNRGYRTWGLCVDQCEFERLALVINLADVPDLPEAPA
jgi:hypothetical protein